MPELEFESSSAERSQRGGLAVSEDISGNRLHLVWSGPRPWGWWRVVVPVAVLAVFAWLGAGQRGPWILAWEQLTGRGAGPRDIGDDILLGVIICGTLWLFWSSCVMLGRFAGYWSEISIDAAEQLLVIRRHGWSLWGHRTTTILFPQLRRLYLRVGQEGRGPFPMRLVVDYRHRDAVNNVSLDFELLDCRTRRQALEFLFSIGRILGVQGYLPTEEDTRNAAWQLLLPYVVAAQSTPSTDRLEGVIDEEEESAGGSLEELSERLNILPIPLTPELGRDEVPIEGAQPTYVDQQLAERVNREQLNEQLVFTQVAEWQPGASVRFVRAQAPFLVFGMAVLFGAAAGAGIGGWPLFGFVEGLVGNGVLWWPGAVILSAVTGAALLGFMAWNQFQEQSIAIDWTDQTVAVHSHSEQFVRSFSDFRGLVLSGVSRTAARTEGDSTPGATEYGCRLDLVLTDRDVALLTSDAWESTSTAARALLQPLASSLAQSLGLKCEWKPYHRATAEETRRVFAFTRLQQAVLTMLAIVAVVGIFHGMSQRRARVDAGQAVRNLGGNAVWLSGFSMKNKSVYKNFWKVEFKSDAEIDKHLQRLRPALVQITDLGIELEDCPLTDAGLQLLAGVSGLRVFTAWQTRMTDAGLESLSHCRELVYLNVAGNQVGDVGLRHCAGLSKLRFLFLGGSQVTDASVETLSQLPSLEYVHLSGSRMTHEGVKQLQASRPGLEIDFVDWQN